MKITKICRLSLAHMVRFLMLELTHTSSHFRFHIRVVFTTTYIFSMVNDIPIDNETHVIMIL
jgi:hypothetical protein